MTYTQDQCYKKLSIKSTARKELLNYALNITDWETQTENNKYSFLAAEVPISIVKLDLILSFCYSYTKVLPKILKMKGRTFYTLHTDSWRSAVLNMLLNDNSDSISFFSVKDFRRNQTFVEVLNYEEDAYYIFNTQIPHAVLNHGDDRFVLSIALSQKLQSADSLQGYNSVVELFQKNNFFAISNTNI